MNTSKLFIAQHLSFISRRTTMNSGAWLRRQKRDPYVRWARALNYRSRAAFKLIEIQDRFQLFNAGTTVLECGAAPGGWTQVLVQLVNSDPTSAYPTEPPAPPKAKSSTRPVSPTEVPLHPPGAEVGVVIGCDIIGISPINGATLLSACEVGSLEGHQRIVDAVRENIPSENLTPTVDVIISDMAPNQTGNTSLDHERFTRLVRALTFLATKQGNPPLLRENGTLVYKLWTSPQLLKLKEELKTVGFKEVTLFKPKSSRKESGEIYIIASKFQIPAK